MTVRDDLTPPERYAERELGKEKREQVNKVGRCRVCIHRSGAAWGRGYCKVNGRTYPLCTKLPGPEFELDEIALATITRKAA
jgi:hypothetical protein